MILIKRVISKIKRIKPVMRLSYLRSSEIVEINPEEAMKRLQQIAPMPKSSALTHNVILPPKYDLTVIVPAYNAAQWIRQCVDSIIKQKTNYTFRVVIIDDGSTDETGNILDSYLPNNRLKVIHQENKGYSGARNIALKRIESRYIMFVDSDDYILPNAIETLLSMAYETESDIVEGNGYTFDENGRIEKIKPTGDGKYLWGGPCLKVMKSTLFERIEFPEGFLYEDTIIGSLIERMSMKTTFVDDEIYAYRIHANSITQKHTAELNRIDSFWIMILMEKCKRKLGINNNMDSYLVILNHVIMTYRRTYLLSDNLKKDIFVCSKAFLLMYYDGFLNSINKYSELVRAILNDDFGNYSFICKSGNLMTD